ncbi:polysaccharide biosynthesis/export family protein [Pontibacter sp. SGAir0037]|uniref:polysaccharide biosynthesis/export family protein n=1 Tax=Pontibacter sp. SGAir0037 TaxID=2571030 RepID=UPI001F113EE8|nr:polysaccharide biosynthesis/export family protein [Pontibacter sp. SGAir0037]
MTKRQLVYMQNDNLKEQVPVNTPNPYTPYKLQPHDVLSVKVQSDQPELSSIFNIVDPSSSFGFGEPGSMYITGYSIDQDGNITLPSVGKLPVAGLTTKEAQDLIQKNVVRYILDATVIVKLISFKVSVLGEVRQPGYYYIYNDRASILEGLAKAGDLTQVANRRNIKLIRQTPNGSETILLDLTDPNLTKSPYYHLMPNDALYIEPSKTQVDRDNIIVLNVVFTAISAAVLLLNYFK